MAYCTLDDLKTLRSAKTLTELTDGVIATSTPDSGVVSAAISAADAEIEGYLSGRYPVPLASTPNLIKYTSMILALEYIYSRRDNIPDAVKSQAARVRAILAEIRDRKMHLDELTESFSASDCISTDYDDRRFDPEEILGDEAENNADDWVGLSSGDFE